MLAQGIAPPVAEYRSLSKIDGSFEIHNDSDYAMAVFLEPKSFTVDDHGVVLFRALDPGIQIRMGSSSFVLRAHDSRTVFYKANFPSAPVSFSIITNVTKAQALKDVAQDAVGVGIRINYVLPHMIYVYQKDKLAKSDIDLTLADGVLHVANLSQKLGRVETVHSSAGDLGGFPLYPGQTRLLPITGGKINVEFEDGFKLEPK